jgi:hypothetical protein
MNDPLNHWLIRASRPAEGGALKLSLVPGVRALLRAEANVPWAFYCSRRLSTGHWFTYAERLKSIVSGRR